MYQTELKMTDGRIYRGKAKKRGNGFWTPIPPDMVGTAIQFSLYRNGTLLFTQVQEIRFDGGPDKHLEVNVYEQF